jgi:hypothetical protein
MKNEAKQSRVSDRQPSQTDGISNDFMVQNNSWETDSHLACQEIAVFYRTKKFITMFRNAHNWPLS